LLKKSLAKTLSRQGLIKKITFFCLRLCAAARVYKNQTSFIIQPGQAGAKKE
jgi:hypothetical protein